MEEATPGAVTLEKFATTVGCHFTTASRLKSGERLPGRELLGRIIEAYGLDAAETTAIFTGSGDGAREAFGAYLRAKIFDKETSVVAASH